MTLTCVSLNLIRCQTNSIERLLLDKLYVCMHAHMVKYRYLYIYIFVYADRSVSNILNKCTSSFRVFISSFIHFILFFTYVLTHVENCAA